MDDAPKELYALMRDGKLFAIGSDREHLYTIVTGNPDFTARNADGSQPIARLIRYVPEDAVNI